MPLITTEYDQNVCQCCGASTISDVRCVCTAYNDWHMNEHGDAACGYHKAELYMKTEKTTVALGAPKPIMHDHFRNWRNTHE